jgi:hypothetical protein
MPALVDRRARPNQSHEWQWDGSFGLSASIPAQGGQKGKREDTMRSELVFRALVQVSNRYQLCLLAIKVTRKLHKPNTPVEGTISDVLDRFHAAHPEAGTPRQMHAAHPVERRRAASKECITPSITVPPSADGAQISWQPVP